MGTKQATPVRPWSYWLASNRHRFSPFFESNGPCYCGRGARHRIHRSTQALLNTPLGRRLFPDDARRAQR